MTPTARVVGAVAVGIVIGTLIGLALLLLVIPAVLVYRRVRVAASSKRAAAM
jgi:hypothetical protein